MEDDEGDASSHYFALLQVLEGLALSDSEKAEALAVGLEAQFQPVDDPAIMRWLMRRYTHTPGK
jgi:hypothetical protein